MSNSFLDEIKKEGLIEEPVTPPESSPEEQTEATASSPTEETPKDEENVPFHKHPRFKAIISENHALKEKVEELSSLKEKVERLESSTTQKSVEIPAWFSEVWGLNEDAWSKYQQFSSAEKAAYKEEIKREILAEQNKEKEETEKWDRWIDSQIEALESEGKTFDRNELMKVMSDYRPTDGQGQYDFHKGYELYSKLKALDEKPEVQKARKEVAAMATSDSKPETTRSKVMTPEEARRTSWTNLI